MKKLIKDWWPVLVILAFVAWKKIKTYRKPGLYYANSRSVANNSDPYMPTKVKQKQDYISLLVRNEFTEAGTCPLCGSEQYARYYAASYDPNTLGGAFRCVCTNPNCERYDNRFTVYY